MAQQQDIPYQAALFSQICKEIIRTFVQSEAVSGVHSIKALQLKEECEQEQTLTHDLMGVILCHSNITQAYGQIKRNKVVTGLTIFTMHGGVRGRGVIPLPNRFLKPLFIINCKYQRISL